MRCVGKGSVRVPPVQNPPAAPKLQHSSTVTHESDPLGGAIVFEIRFNYVLLNVSAVVFEFIATTRY